jgi:hypothetical protein
MNTKHFTDAKLDAPERLWKLLNFWGKKALLKCLRKLMPAKQVAQV